MTALQKLESMVLKWNRYIVTDKPVQIVKHRDAVVTTLQVTVDYSIAITGQGRRYFLATRAVEREIDEETAYELVADYTVSELLVYGLSKVFNDTWTRNG